MWFLLRRFYHTEGFVYLTLQAVALGGSCSELAEAMGADTAEGPKAKAQETKSRACRPYVSLTEAFAITLKGGWSLMEGRY